MKVSKKLLSIKGHYFLFNAGTAPLVPYLSTYARQLGFSSATVGLIYTILPIFGLIAKPLFGVIADKFKKQKSIFILFEIVTIVSFTAIYFIPGNGTNISVELDCGNGVSELKSCFQTEEQIDTCKMSSLSNENYTAKCDMNCNMSSPKMWEQVCEHWHIPKYCYSNTDSIHYTSHANSITLNGKCVYIGASSVTLDGFNYVPRCHIGGSYIDINEPCNFNCSDQNLSSIIGTNKAFMTCYNESLSHRLCLDNISTVTDFMNTSLSSECQASCNLDDKKPWKLMEICESWHADAADTCQARGDLPKNLSFTGVVRLSTTIAEHNCVYIQLKHIELPDGSVHYSNCVSKPPYQSEVDLFRTSCEINCDNTKLNELFQEAAESVVDNNQFTTQFWLFFLMMIISWIGQAVVVTFADAICFNLLGTKISNYGKQRLWGSVGWGIFSLLTGTLIDVFSDGAYKDYTIAFILMFVFMTGDVIVSLFIKVDSTKMSMNILADVGALLTSLPTFIFFLWTISVGLCTGLLWQFLFWHLEDISKLSCDGSDYVKTLQGLVSAIQTFCGEIPFLFVSGFILKKLGHVNMMSIVLFVFGVRFLLYSALTNPWWVLPIEMLQGITFGMFYPTMTSYATVVSPPGTETTVQGLVGAIFEGVGTSLGSFIGGQLYGVYGGATTFQWFGLGSLVCCVLHIIAQYLIKDKTYQIGLNQGKDATCDPDK